MILIMCFAAVDTKSPLAAVRGLKSNGFAGLAWIDKMCDKLASDSAENDIAHIFKDMSYAPVKEACTIAEVNNCCLVASVSYSAFVLRAKAFVSFDQRQRYHSSTKVAGID